MNKQLAIENKSKLEVERERLKAILGVEGKHEGKGEFPGDYKPQFKEIGDDEGENALEVSNFEAELGVTTDLEEKLSKVEAALKRIETGTYGSCSVCGEPIEENRMRALPEADACLKHSR